MNTKNDLIKSYWKVYEAFLKKDQISINDIKNSIDIFEKYPKIIPKKFEVIAIVSGLPFEIKFQKNIIKIQSEIRNILGKTLHYFVKPDNLAVEYLVIKWPNDKYDLKTILDIKTFLEDAKFKKFYFEIKGVQIHSDGCIVLQGFSENMEINKYRKKIITNFPNLPKKQSEWSHIPIGRFVEPLNIVDKRKINHSLKEINSNFTNFRTEINSFHLVHEHRWYMEEFNKIYTKIFI